MVITLSVWYTALRATTRLKMVRPRQVLDVDASRGDICGDEDSCGSRLEVIKSLLAIRLLAVPVNALTADIPQRQIRRDVVSPATMCRTECDSVSRIERETSTNASLTAARANQTKQGLY